MLKLFDTELEGLFVVESRPISDRRGQFSRLYCKEELASIIGDRSIMQVNQSTSCVLGTVRGMHYQLPPSAEMKLVRCTRGRVWDIVIDLRHNSDTYLRWRAEELSSQNNKMVIIPEGFAHGFQTLEPDCEMLYLHTKEHNPDMERAIRYDDPMIGIKWPVEVSNISERDKNHSYLDDSFKGVMV